MLSITSLVLKTGSLYLLTTFLHFLLFLLCIAGKHKSDLFSHEFSSDNKESACNTGGMSSIPGSGRSLEKGMSIHTSIRAWRIPWTEKPGGL